MDNLKFLISLYLKIPVEEIQLESAESEYYVFSHKNKTIKYFLNYYPYIYSLYKEKFKLYYEEFDILGNIVVTPKFQQKKICSFTSVKAARYRLRYFFKIDIFPEVEYINDYTYFNDIKIIQELEKSTYYTGEKTSYLLQELQKLDLNDKYFYHFNCPEYKELYLSKDNLYKNILKATNAVIQMCKKTGRKLIFASSTGIYDYQKNSDKINFLVSEAEVEKISPAEIASLECSNDTLSYSPDLEIPELSDVPSENKSVYLQMLYNYYKLKCEELIVSQLSNFLILRIPRVYGSNLNKGLLNPNNTVFNLDKVVEFMDIKDFISETKKILHTKGIYEYKNLQRDSIKNIIKKYN